MTFLHLEKGKSFGEIYKTDNEYLHWLETTDRFFKIDFDELKQLYPEVKESLDIPIFERKIDFGKYKGQTFNDIKEDIPYLQWLISIEKISNEEFKLLTSTSESLK